MTSDNTSEASESSLNRRDALKGGLVAIGAAIAPSSVSQPAMAQSVEPRIQLGDDWAIDDDADGNGNNDLRLEHQPTGAELRYDVDSGAWIPNQPIGTDSDRQNHYGDTGDYNSVSTEHLDNEALTEGIRPEGDNRSYGWALMPASPEATGGSGRYTAQNDPYTGGAIQSTYDELQNKLDRETLNILVDGSYKEGQIDLTVGASTLFAFHWHSNIRGTGTHVVNIENSDNFLIRQWLAHASQTSGALINCDTGSDQQAETFVNQSELSMDNSDHGLNLINANEFFLAQNQFVGTPSTSAWNLDSVEDFIASDQRIDDGDVVLSGDLRDVHLSNITVKNGLVDIDPNTLQDVTIDNISVRGSGKGLFLQGSASGAQLSDVDLRSNTGRAIDCRVDDVRITGHVKGNDDIGIVWTGSNGVFEGYAKGNYLSSGSEDLRIAGTCSGNVFRGRFGDVTVTSGTSDNEIYGQFDSISGYLPNNSTRTVINGVGYNTGDPSSTGDWNGNGREGVTVYDVSVSRPYTEYQYIDGVWQSA